MLGLIDAGTSMRPLLHPSLVNGRSGDPALYVETLFERRAILFDLGDISSLSPRKIQRLDLVCVSHAHIDHFIGFDHLLRVLVGRDKTIKLRGPQGFIDHVHHKLSAYRWNLVDRFAADLVFLVTEVDSRLGIQVNDHLSCRISRRNFGVQPAAFRLDLTLPFDLLARTSPSAKRRMVAMFLAPWPAR